MVYFDNPKVGLLTGQAAYSCTFPDTEEIVKIARVALKHELE